MRIRLRWDVSRCVGPGGIRLRWDEETGWAYTYVGPGYSIPRGPATSLQRVYATAESVAVAADSEFESRGGHHPVRAWSGVCHIPSAASLDGHRVGGCLLNGPACAAG